MLATATQPLKRYHIPEGKWHVTRSIVDGWLNSVEKAEQAKRSSLEIAQMCELFYSGDVGQMWEKPWVDKFLSGAFTPRWKFTFGKVFELVAQVAPRLYWRNPARIVQSYPRLEILPALFGQLDDPNAQQAFEQAKAEQDYTEQLKTTRNNLLQHYLNYSQREQPQGLAAHSRKAIVESLVKGRGILRVSPYRPVGANRVLTKATHVKYENLLIDPDCEDPLLEQCYWIAIVHDDPQWEVEDRWKVPRGSLKPAASHESAASIATRNTWEDKADRSRGQTNDIVRWYEFWSKMGVGTRLKSVSSPLSNRFEEVLGDYAYIAVAHNIPFALNAPVINASTSEADIHRWFDWPEPYHEDGRWPIATLEYYYKLNSPWPLPPIAMGLGYLIFLQVIATMLADRAEFDSRTIVATYKRCAESVSKALFSNKRMAVVELEEVFNKQINETVQFMQKETLNFDVWRIIEYFGEMFEKATGLTPYLYGGQGGQSQARIAGEVKVRKEASDVRPEFMAEQVEDWQSEIANLERIALHGNVLAEDVRDILDPFWLPHWKALIDDTPRETYLRETSATVEANSVRKPNSERTNANLQALAQYLLPAFQRYAELTGDQKPLWGFLKSIAKAMQEPADEWEMGPWKPQQPEMTPEQQAMQEQAMQAAQQQQQVDAQTQQYELQKLQLAIDKAMIDLQAAQQKVDGGQVELAGESAKRQLELDAAQAKGSQELQLDQAKGLQDIRYGGLTREQEITHKAALGAIEIAKQRQSAGLTTATAATLAQLKIRESAALSAQRLKAKPKQPSKNGD